MDAIEGFRLSPVQRAIWAQGRRDGHGVVRARLALTGPVNGDRLAAALTVLADRHEALRLRLAEYPGLGAPLQVVDDQRPVPVADQDGAGSLDQPADPLRVTLTGDELVLTGSRLNVDPVSLGALVRELAAAYRGGVLPDDEDRLQFVDVSVWQNEQPPQGCQGSDGEPAADPTVIRRIDLPFSPAAPAVASGTTYRAPAQHVSDITGEELAGLRGVAGERSCELQALLLTAWSLALAPYWAASGTEAGELALAWYDDGRSVAGTNDVVGPLGSHVPLLLTATGNPKEVLDAVSAALAQARRHSLVTAPVHDPALVAAGFAYFETPGLPAAGDLPVGEISIDAPEPVGAPHLGCVLDADRLRLTLTFDPAVHDADVCWRLLESVRTVPASLPAALHDPEQLRRIGPAESVLLAGWSGAQPAQHAGTLVELLDAGIAGAGDADAVIAEDGTVTFRALDTAASALAGRLTGNGVGAEDRVVVLADRSWRTVVAFVGILRAGAVYVPLDPAQPRARLRELATAVGATAVVGGAAELRAELADRFRTLPVELAADEPVSVAAPVAEDQAAYVIFTSGSTGTPRPVVVEHGAVARLWHAIAEQVYRDPGVRLRVAVNAPFTFDASIKQLIQLASGHTLCVVPEETRRDGRLLLDHLAGNRCDVFDCTPSHLRIVLDARRDGDRLPSTLLIGGEAIDAELWRKLGALDGVRAVNLYGPTECTVDVTAAEITRETEPTIGRPLPGTRVWVLDAELRPVPAGAAGELCVSGPRLARGYQDDEYATAARFVTATVPDGTPVRVYRTGDLVCFQRDGRLRYLGRTDDQVKIKGYRIEPGEVAAALRRHPAVGQATVVATDGDGEGPRLVGYAVPAPRFQAAVQPDRLAEVNPHETRYLYDEIFVQQVYQRGGITMRDGGVIFDVGANIGMFSLFALAICPNSRVYAFEPLAPAFEKLAQNLAGNGESVTLLPFGLSQTEREETFTFYPGYSMMSGQYTYADPAAEVQVVKRFLANERDRGAAGRAELLRDVDDLLTERFRVVEQRCRLRRLSDVIDEYAVDRIDLLKVDVQRAELDVLLGLDDPHWPKIQQVAMEVHDEPGTPTEGRVAALRSLFEQRGFRVVVEQDELMAGTGRHSLYAVRPEYQRDPRPARSLRAPSGATPDQPVAGPALRDWLAERLPGYLVPGAVVVLDELPLTANGKVDRAALPSPDATGSAVGAAPANRAEAILLEVWREVLGRTDVGVEDQFFRFGGDSIRAIRVRAAAARRGLTFPLRHVVRYQTIRELVRESGLAEQTGEQAEGLAHTAFAMVDAADRANLPDGLDDAYPVSALQLGLIYHSELSEARAGYHVVTVHRIGARLDVDRLRTALAGTAAGHPILRTSFDLGRFREPLQLVHREVQPLLTVEDVRSLDAAQQRGRLAATVAGERSTPFDWTVAPLLRCRVLHTAEGAFELVLTHYHGVLDGWSLHLLLHELCVRYDALLAGAAAPADQAPVLPYWRFVELERAAAQRQESVEFWRARLAGVQPLAVAGGRDGEAVAVARTTAQQIEPLPAELAGVLAGVAAERGVPLKSLLLAVHLRVLGEETSRDDVVGGLVVNGRPGEDGGDRALGLFINTVPVRLALGTDPLLVLAERAWRAEQDLTGHHLMPLATIERTVRSGQLFDTFFNFTRFHPLDGSPVNWTREDAEQDVPVDVAFGLAVDFEVEPATGALRLTLQYDGRRLSEARIRSMAARYRLLLDMIADDPAGLAELPPAGPAARPAARSGELAGQVAEIWRELTGAEPASGDAGFVDSGGSSLLALRFVSMLRHRHGVAVELRDFRRDDRFESAVRLANAAQLPGQTVAEQTI